MAEVHLPQSLLALFPGAPRRLEVEAATVDDLLQRLQERFPGMRTRLVDAGPRLREHIKIFVDTEEASLATPIQTGSVVRVIPALSGG